MKNRIVQSSVFFVGLFSLSSAMAQLSAYIAPGYSDIDTPSTLSLPYSQRIESLTSEAGIKMGLTQTLSLALSYGVYDELHRIGGLHPLFGSGSNPDDFEERVRSANLKLQYLPINKPSGLLPYFQAGYSRWYSTVTLIRDGQVTSESDRGYGYNYGMGFQGKLSPRGGFYLELNRHKLDKISVKNLMLGMEIVFF